MLPKFQKLKLLLVDNMIWVILFATFIIFGILVPQSFLTLQNIHFILYVSTMIGLLTVAEGLVLISGNFDLSIGQIAGFSAMASAVLIINFPAWMPGFVGIILITVIGGVAGAVNGFLVGRVKLNPFLVTLGTYIGFYWGTTAIRQGSVLRLPSVYLAPGGSRVLGIYISIPLFLLIAVLLAFFLSKSRLGSNIFAVGGNQEAARRCGINVGAVIMITYILGGVLAGLAGLLYTGYMSVATSNLAEGTVFTAFAGAVLGGVSLQGGSGKIQGILGGVLLLGCIDAGLTMMGIDPSWQGIFTGILVILAILVNRTREKLRDKILSPVK